MKSIEQLQIEISNEEAVVRENKAKSLLIDLGNMITKRHGWIRRRQEEIVELTDFDNKMRKAYREQHNSTLDAIRVEIDGFDEKNKGRSRINYGRN